MTISPGRFKESLARYAAGVTVVMARDGDRAVGATVSSFTSVSLTPPLVLICLQKRLGLHGAIREHGAFAVSMLTVGQVELGKRFAGLVPHVSDRMAGVAVEVAQTGSPILQECAAWVDCTLWNVYDGGDHTIFVGEVLAAGSQPTVPPLLYFDRDWHRGERLPARAMPVERPQPVIRAPLPAVAVPSG